MQSALFESGTVSGRQEMEDAHNRASAVVVVEVYVKIATSRAPVVIALGLRVYKRQQWL